MGDVTVVVEERIPESKGFQDASGLSDLSEQATHSFEEALSRTAEIAKEALGKLKSLEPEELELSFGIKLSGEYGIIIASGSGEANFEIKLKWKPKE